MLVILLAHKDLPGTLTQYQYAEVAKKENQILL